MKKVSTASSDKLMLRFVMKTVITTILSILLFSFIFSEITYKLDLNTDINNIFSILIAFLCAVTTSFFSVKGLKNNGAVMGIISEIPLLFYSLLNLVFYDTSIVFYLIKLVIIVLCGALFGILAVKKSKTFKVK